MLFLLQNWKGKKSASGNGNGNGKEGEEEVMLCIQESC
jgi:hypothetical protein